LRRLSPTQRIVFALRDLEAMDVDEVARVAGLTVGSVKTNLSYARRAIRQWLADEYHVEESHT
jgi:DNA-directed RNA polymerase specialized sigma24 family protein